MPQTTTTNQNTTQNGKPEAGQAGLSLSKVASDQQAFAEMVTGALGDIMGELKSMKSAPVQVPAPAAITQKTKPATTTAAPKKELAQMTHAELLAEAEALRQAKSTGGRISMKVSEKGALSVYGLMRFPVTLYREQWERLVAEIPAIKQFIANNAATLAVKER